MTDRADWIIFAYGNRIPFGHDFTFSHGVPAGIYFKPKYDASFVHLTAPGYGMLGHADIDGHSLYGSGSISVPLEDLKAALASGHARKGRGL